MKVSLKKPDDINIYNWMVSIWGERCSDYEPLCPCCVAWEIHDATGMRAKLKQVTDTIEGRQPKEVCNG